MSILFHEIRSFWPEGCISDARLKEVACEGCHCTRVRGSLLGL